jgi:hypothetical protein
MVKFERPHHQLVRVALNSLNSRFLSESMCYFGGGTRIVLELDEYRESLDIDFLCADKQGYRALRSTISHHSLGAICIGNLQLLREVRADMYGIRTFFVVDGKPVKFEIISEGRIPLEGESIQDLPVESLNRVSCFAEKFLANADRARDTSTHSRDLVDLAFMTASWSIDDLTEGWFHAEEAYGGAVHTELLFALDELGKSKVRKSCIHNLALTNPRKLDRGLNALRQFCESKNCSWKI